MVTKKIADLPRDEVLHRWREQIEGIGLESNYITGHQIRYRLVERWLSRRRSAAWLNRHLQAFGWISRLWVTETLMSVRRQLDDQHQTISLKQLLHEIEARPGVIDVTAIEVAEDRETLVRLSRSALEFGHRQVAHSVPWQDAFLSTNELHAPLDAINATARKYYRIIMGGDLPVPDREPDPQWLRSFEVPWKSAPHARSKGRRPAKGQR